MSVLGIYFGPKVISIVDIKNKKIIASINILRKVIIAGELEQKVPEEVMLVALFKDELRKNKIEIKDIKDATVALSGKDLLVRTFEIPVIPQAEVTNAVNFEAKKYIPFKAEELISDFQIELDKPNRKNLVLFVGIRKETLEKYISVLKQVGIKVSTIEYAPFSLLRCQRLLGIGEKGIYGVISMNFPEEDEVNFTVLKDGFPLFSRDISLPVEGQEAVKEDHLDQQSLLERLKGEIRISLDYYHRKFPQKNIQKTFFLASQDFRQGLETLSREIGLSAYFLDVAKYTGKPESFSLALIKSYTAALSKEIKIKPKTNLLTVRMTKIQGVDKGLSLKDASSLFSGLKVDPRAVVFGALICLLTYLYGMYRIAPLKKSLAEIMGRRPQVSTVSADKSYDELSGVNSDYKKKINTLGDLITQQMYITEILDIIPRVAPEGLWLTNFDFIKQDAGAILNIKGRVYLANHSKEFEAVNAFISGLKDNARFSKSFADISIVSVDTVGVENVEMTEYSIACRSQAKR